MKTTQKIILSSVFSIFLFSSFLIPITSAQEWTYDGADTEKIPHFSVYPSEWYVFQPPQYPPEILVLLDIVKGNLTDYMMMGKGTCVWGNAYMWNTTSGEKTLIYADVISYWNETVGFHSEAFAYIIPVENDGKVSLPILTNISLYVGMLLADNNFEHQQVYPSKYSIAFWNSSNNAYFNLNYTDDGILNKWESYIVPMGNLTLYSQPAQLPPDFSFTTEDDILIVNSTDFKLTLAITDADNNNDGVTDMDYLFRILNGSTWTDWATPLSIPLSIIDWDLGAVPAGNYSITMEVKNMYGVTQEQITIQYTPPKVPSDEEVISGYPILIVSIVTLLCILIIFYNYRKKLRF